MSGGDFGGRLERVGFWAGFSFVFSFLCRFSFLSCCLFRLACGVCFRSQICMLRIWDFGDAEMTDRTRRRMVEEKSRVLRTRWLGRSCGGKTAPTTTKPCIEWVRDWVRVIAALHHAIDKVEKASLDGIRHHDSDRPHQLSSHFLSFFSLLFLSSSQSTISLRLLPPYAPRNETSIFVASYGSCSAIS